MGGRVRAVFQMYAETAGLEPPPRGALAAYAEDTLNQIPALRSRCGEGARDEEKLAAIGACESAARGLLQWIADKPPRASRAARGAPAPATTPAPPPRASTRTVAVRDRYRRMRM